MFEEIQALMPHEQLIYISDSGFAPYGNKPDAFIVERSMALAEFLIDEHDIKALVVACNTATAAAIHKLREQLDIPVVGMEPGIKPAVERTESGVIGVLATENTLKSDKFSNLLDTHHHRARILTQPCHGLVDAIEQGDLDSPATETLLTSYLKPLLDEGADTVVLGCTHYPLLTPLIEKIAGNDVHLISTGAAVARHLQRLLEVAGAMNDVVEQADAVYYTSGNIPHIKTLVERLFGRKVALHALPQALLPNVNDTFDTEIIEFELEDKYQLLFQAMLQGEDGLAMVRCIDGVQQIWTTTPQLDELMDWLKCLPEHFNVRILRKYRWEQGAA